MRPSITSRADVRSATTAGSSSRNCRHSVSTTIASAPATILGKIEVYGIGIVETETVQNVPVALLVTLDEPVARMPAEATERIIAGIALPVLGVSAYEASAPIKIEIAVKSWGKPTRLKR